LARLMPDRQIARLLNRAGIHQGRFQLRALRCAVAGALYRPTAVHDERGIKQIAMQRPQSREDGIQIGAGKPAVTDDIGNRDGRYFPHPPHGAPSVRCTNIQPRPPGGGRPDAAHCLDVYDHYAWRYYPSVEGDKAWHFLATDDSRQDSYFSADNQVKSAELNFFVGRRRPSMRCRLQRRRLDARAPQPAGADRRRLAGDRSAFGPPWPCCGQAAAQGQPQKKDD